MSAVAMLAVVSGCGLLGGAEEKPAETASAGKLEKAKINLGLLPILDVASVHVAIKKGYFKEEGLEVEVKIVQGGAAAIPAVIKGDLDITFGNWVSFITAETNGAAKGVDGLKLINDGYQAKPEMFLILAKSDSAIKSPKDLEGKTIAINTFKNIAELTAKATLEANDVNPDNVTFKEFPFPDMEAAVQNGTVDAAFMVEPFISRAQRASGQITVLDAASGPTDGIPIAGYGTTGKFVKENPNTVAAFQRAMAKGQRDAADRPTVEPLLVEYAKVDKETASLVHFGEFPTTLDATRLQRVADLMRTYKLLENEFDVKTMLVGASGS
ncbi:NitT/TauT family transport system substrate-binding protein [Saccharothrix ecbatanensis]|uniref:NitT/TauT family transport system substrate-binding protein n=1 Tax=Saccharothrix ecbatanensis TaxID=1105145 RepID=A0A7W9M298_9PSEU|nr:ABC transporter substrate-binding protein [Saccharothrix ecbatanensis]MBB5804779.1 NitT/TauT family transport system substrate-binding protein [Saccharothrix ecbatanensis]